MAAGADDRQRAGAPSDLLDTLGSPPPRHVWAASAGYAGAGPLMQEAGRRGSSAGLAREAPAALSAGLASHHPHATTGSTSHGAPACPADDPVAAYRRRMQQGTHEDAAATRLFPRPMTASSRRMAHAGSLDPSLTPSVGRESDNLIQPEMLAALPSQVWLAWKQPPFTHPPQFHTSCSCAPLCLSCYSQLRTPAGALQHTAGRLPSL